MFTICLDHQLRSTEPLEVVTCTCPERKVKMVSKGVTDLKNKNPVKYTQCKYVHMKNMNTEFLLPIKPTPLQQMAAPP